MRAFFKKVLYYSHLNREVANMSEEGGAGSAIGKIVLFFFGAWLLANYLDSKRKKDEFVTYSCWNCGYTLWRKGIPNCPNCGVHLHWGNPDFSSESPRTGKPPISPMVSFMVFVITLIAVFVCLFVEVKSPQSFETIKIVCSMSFGYAIGQR